VSVAGQDLAKELLLAGGVSDAGAAAQAKFAFGVIEIIGWAAGMLSFGPLCVRLGRRWTFIFFQAISLVVVPMTCYVPTTYNQLLLLLPLYGFATVGIQAGFAIYFPELFPSHLRSTGAGFCFNAGRVLAAPVLVFSGWLKSLPGVNLHLAITLMNLLFLFGIGVVLLLPETKDRPLPE
jgi:MFS family permease